MTDEESSTSNCSSPIENKRTATSEQERTFTVAQLGPGELRHAIVSPDEDIGFFSRLTSSSDEAQPMRQNCSPVSAERTWSLTAR